MCQDYTTIPNVNGEITAAKNAGLQNGGTCGWRVLEQQTPSTHEKCESVTSTIKGQMSWVT